MILKSADPAALLLKAVELPIIALRMRRFNRDELISIFGVVEAISLRVSAVCCLPVQLAQATMRLTETRRSRDSDAQAKSASRASRFTRRTRFSAASNLADTAFVRSSTHRTKSPFSSSSALETFGTSPHLSTESASYLWRPASSDGSSSQWRALRHCGWNPADRSSRPENPSH